MRNWLIKVRAEKGLNPQEIADKCGISKNYYGMLEMEKRNPSVTLAQKIAELMNFDWTLFFSNEAECRLPVTSSESVTAEHS